MAKLFIEDTSLVAIGDAIREKTGQVDTDRIVVRTNNVTGFTLEDWNGSPITSPNPTTELVEICYPVRIEGAKRIEMTISAFLGTSASFGNIKVVPGYYENPADLPTTSGTNTTHKILYASSSWDKNKIIYYDTDSLTIRLLVSADRDTTRYGFYAEIQGFEGSWTSAPVITISNKKTYSPAEMATAILGLNIGEGITPEGELEILENGTYDVTEYASAQVSVPVGVFPEGTLEIAENGEYTVTTYDKVNVAVASSGGGDMEPMVLSGNCNYACSGQLANAMVEKYGHLISTNGITSASFMFQGYKFDTIPFDINFVTYAAAASDMFNSANIKELPVVNNLKMSNSGMSSFFAKCTYLREVPDGFSSNWDWSGMTGVNYTGTSMFQSDMSLRYICPDFLNKATKTGSNAYYSHPFYNMFSYCYNLDAIKNLSPGTATAVTGNLFQGTFNQNSSLREFTFEWADEWQDSGLTANWQKQTIDLSKYTGYFQSAPSSFYNSGRSMEKRITDATTYQQYKLDADAWTTDANYAFYNRASAVKTIKSLPDCSAYLASSGGTANVIKFKGEAGASTEAGAINTMTDAEIAVATAKGWTVTFA